MADARRYHAAVHTGRLPRAYQADDHAIHRGYVVDAQSQWWFFTGIEPAMVFGRAIRMSDACNAYGVFAAARELMWCEGHRRDEFVLHVVPANLDRQPDELAIFQRFFDSVVVHHDSSHWRGPVGR